MSTPDFFRSRLDEMIDMTHPLVVLAQRLPWDRIEQALAPHFARQARPDCQIEKDDLLGCEVLTSNGTVSNAGRPRLSIRLLVSLQYLKNAYKLSDEQLMERWSENVVWQYFGGLQYYEPRLPCDATQLGRFRREVGEEGLEQLLKATIETAVDIKAIKPAEFERVIVDTTVQEKAIAHPVDSRLLEIARHKVVSAAKCAGIKFKQTYAGQGKTLHRRAGGYAHAKQFKRLKNVVSRQRTILGIVIREVRRKLPTHQLPEYASQTALSSLNTWLPA
jgi:transposase, IS5 family